jgi:MFS family permease
MGSSSGVELHQYPPEAGGNETLRNRQALLALLAALGLALLSSLAVAPAPSYDPLSWLLWGREIAGGDLSTAEGPAFKPLPVAVCALLSLLGAVAPWAWVVVARVGALLALWLTFRLGRRLAGGSAVAGGLAAVAVALCGAYLGYASHGVITGWLLALALAGIEAWRGGRPRLALACALACGLLQVESWPFLLALGALVWRRRPEERPLLLACAGALPALWFVPEWLGSGDLLRSAERAQIPNPGQPALAEVPALASLGEALRLALWPLWLGAGALAAMALRRRPAARLALAPAAVGLAWIAIVAAMAQVGGFSGEPRYALPGMALISISGAVGLATAGRPGARLPVALTLAAVGLIAVAALPRLGAVERLPAAQAYQRDLSKGLAQAIDAAGGREAVLRCGQVYVGPLRGPLMAYRLQVPKRAVEPDLPPRAPAVVFSSRRAPGVEVEPEAGSGFREIAGNSHWQVLSACKVRMP